MGAQAVVRGGTALPAPPPPPIATALLSTCLEYSKFICVNLAAVLSYVHRYFQF